MGWHGEGITDVGQIRTTNQDAFRLLDHLNLWVIADGMSGHAGGEIASTLAVETIGSYVDNHRQPCPPNQQPLSYREEVLRNAIETANHAIRLSAERSPHYAGMGTTIVVLQIVEESTEVHALIAHAGDSRAYLIRGDSMTGLSRDHSLVEEQIQRGLLTPEEALVHPLRHVLTKAVGIEHRVDPSVTTHLLRPQDRLLLCTDGLTKMMSDQHILQILQENAGLLKEVCRALISEANALGGEDNSTVVMVGKEERESLHSSSSSRT